jgi:hypothetical protein
MPAPPAKSEVSTAVRDGGKTRRRLETSALVVGYAMSRLDTAFLRGLGFRSWNEAYTAFGRALDTPAKSLKGLRDEFDPIHPNPRRGWADRPMIDSRARVAAELCDVSDAALVELVRALLRTDLEAARDALDALAEEQRAPAAAAERLLTGRRAEEFVLAECRHVLGVAREALVDHRDRLLGFDFEIRDERAIVVEVKGLRTQSGNLLFTDREWREAHARRKRYWVAVVGNALTQPRARLYVDPIAQLNARCVYERTVSARWRATVDLAS